MHPSPAEVTQLLVDWSQGNQAAGDQLMRVVYDELRRLAGYYLGRERPNHTLQATALVHEAYLRLIDQHNVQWQNRAHFFAVAAKLMRRILVDHARSHHALKRGGCEQKLSLEEALAFSAVRDVNLVALDDALSRLASLDPNQSRIIELRFFGGLTIEEVAEALRISPATVKNKWNLARAWLHREICERGSHDA